MRITGNCNVVGEHNTVSIQNITQPLPDPMDHKAGYQGLTPPRPFIGREKERRDLAEAMLAGEVRLICGLGGVGKTALALRVAQDLADAGNFPEGILWIPLEGNPGPETVAVWILAAFGIKPEGNLTAQMAQAFNHYCPLLILDNAEAAPQTVDAILACRGKAAALVTSRNAGIGLNAISGIPDDLAPLKDADAIDLLHSRLGPMKIEDDQAGELNKLVGGLPLALVLAAGFITRTLRRDSRPVETYLDLLRRSPLTALELDHRRERSIQVTFDLSWECLDESARQVMAVLAVLPGESADIRALATVLNPGPVPLRRIFKKVLSVVAPTFKRTKTAQGKIQDLIWALENFSLITRIGTRYSLHPLLRNYVADQIPAQKARMLCKQLEQYYLDYAMQGNGKNQYGEHLDIEHDNVLGAMVWAREKQEWHKVVAFAEAVDFYLQLRGYSKIRLDCADWRLNAARQLKNRHEEANALQRVGDVHYMLAEYRTARSRYEEALPIYRAVNDRLGEANALYSIGNVARMLAEHEAARSRYEEALPIYRSINARRGEANTLWRLGDVHYLLTEYEAARERYEEALPIYQTIDDHLGKANVLQSLGDIHWMLTEAEAAREQYKKALLIYQGIGARMGEANAMLGLGDVYFQFAEYKAAKERYEEALRAYQAIGNRLGEANALKGLGNVHLHLDEYELAQVRYEEALTIYQAINHRPGEAHALKELGNLHYAQDEYSQALEFCKEALAIYRSLGNRHGEANVIRSFGEIHLKRDEFEEAQKDLTAALSIYQTINERVGIASSLRGLGNVARCQHRWENATQLYRQSLEICREIGERYEEASTLTMQGYLAAVQSDRETARQLFNEALTIFERIGARPNIIEIQGRLAELR